jgi:hypothetical protein
VVGGARTPSRLDGPFDFFLFFQLDECLGGVSRICCLKETCAPEERGVSLICL